MTEDKKPQKIYTGTYAVQPDQLEKKKNGKPSKSSLAVVAAMIEEMEGATNPFDYFKVSFAISIAPGYIAAIINPESTGYSFTAPIYQAVAIAETVVGTFLWAGFIATFAKKYMR